MEHKITGCTDCPYYFSECSSPCCLHPNRPVKYGIWNNGRFIELPYQIAPDNLYQADGYSISLKTEPLEIKQDENFKPITPDWCPLNTEPITIIKS